MDWTFFVQRLPDAVQDKILAMADGCLSRQYRGEPRLCRFRLFRDHDGMVLDEEWWAPGLEDGDDWGELCQMCGRRRDLLPANVAYVQLSLHRRIRQINWDYNNFPFERFQTVEERAVCDECFALFLCNGVLLRWSRDTSSSSSSEASDRTW
jgi:hypothetical protein